MFMATNTKQLTVGTKIFYSGDMANASGNFEITAVVDYGYDLKEIVEETAVSYDDGNPFKPTARVFRSVMSNNIGTKYEGHCNPRFVTADSVAAYKAERIAAWQLIAKAAR